MGLQSYTLFFQGSSALCTTQSMCSSTGNGNSWVGKYLIKYFSNTAFKNNKKNFIIVNSTGISLK